MCTKSTGPGMRRSPQGMFAFAIYDQTHRELFLAAIGWGKNRRFDVVLGGALHFASEIKAFRHSPAWDDSIDLDYVEGYLSLGHSSRRTRSTVTSGSSSLATGCGFATERWRFSITWDVTDFDSDGRDERAIPAMLNDHWRSVRERLESEVPLRGSLSGGIDSGLAVFFMAEVPEHRTWSPRRSASRRGSTTSSRLPR